MPRSDRDTRAPRSTCATSTAAGRDGSSACQGRELRPLGPISRKKKPNLYKWHYCGRLQKVGIWMPGDLCWVSSFCSFGIRGRSYSNFLASAVGTVGTY